jgi:hypothetical protein
VECGVVVGDDWRVGWEMRETVALCKWCLGWVGGRRLVVRFEGCRFRNRKPLGIGGVGIMR